PQRSGGKAQPQAHARHPHQIRLQRVCPSDLLHYGACISDDRDAIPRVRFDPRAKRRRTLPLTRSNQTPARTAAPSAVPYTMRPVASATNSALNEPVTRKAIHPPPTATMIRRKPQSSGQNKRPAPCDAKYSDRPSPKNPYAGPTMRKYAAPVLSMCASSANRPSHAWGHKAAVRPMASVMPKASALPTNAMRTPRPRWPAQILVPTSATSGAPRPNTNGISRYSSRAPVPYPATAFGPPPAPTSAVVKTNTSVVCNVLTVPTAPTRRMSTNSALRNFGNLGW